MKTYDLSKEPPRSPRVRLRDYAILARAIDKCRAHLVGTEGEYHFNCPLDQELFSFKGIDPEDFKLTVSSNDTDDPIALWVDQAGIHRTPHEIADWSNDLEEYNPSQDADRKEWFEGECKKLGLDPATTTLFDYLEADDTASFK